MFKVKLKPCDGPCGKDKPIWKNHLGKRYCADCWRQIKPTESIKRSSLSPSNKPIPKESDKRKKEHVLYSTMRLVFLNQNPVCKMNIAGICTNQATDVQHLKGRGMYYLDVRFWMPACRVCHSYADTHPQEAIENGWALPRISNQNEDNNPE